jgi:hypothetical protein
MARRWLGDGPAESVIWRPLRAPATVRMRLFEYNLWCAWQELNLLPFGPEPNALSGELQARAPVGKHI